MRRWTQFFVNRGSGYWQKIGEGWDIEDEGMALSAKYGQPLYDATYSVAWWDLPGERNPPGKWTGKWVNAAVGGVANPAPPAGDPSQIVPTPPVSTAASDNTGTALGAVAGAVVGAMGGYAAAYIPSPYSKKRPTMTERLVTAGLGAVAIGFLGALIGRAA